MLLKQCEVESRVEFFKNPDIQETIKSYKTIKKWAYILHDKDETAPHYHIYLNFGNSSVDTKYIADWFGLQESQVNRIKGRSTDMLLYLTHGNETQKNKYQYSPTEVVANFDFETEIKNSQILGDWEHFSYAQQLEYVNTLPVAEKITAFGKLEKLWKLQCQLLSKNTDRNLEVIFIYGKPKAGKTYYAKKLFKQMNMDFCVSSSSNDPFQDYLGQKGMLLDDVRDNMFINANGTDNLEDLLKILDHNTASSVRSRFSNKVFNGEVIIMTSTKPLKFWFPKRKSSGYDDLSQLYRRISCYVEITTEYITVYSDGLDENGNPKGSRKSYKNELAVMQEKEIKKTDFYSVFDNMCEKASSVELLEPIPEELPF